MTWLVTGGSGFLGRHLLATLAGRGERVVALGRHLPGGWSVRDFVRADLDDLEATTRVVSAIAPDIVIHAAGKTPPAPSSDLYLANVRGTMHVLDALRDSGRPCRLVLAGSAAELGSVPVEALPVSETFPCQPVEAYGLSKWAATRLGLMASPPLSVMIGRIFNMIGPGLPTSQAFGRFASDLANPDLDTIRAGDLDARRDFVDVRDAAEALIALAIDGTPGAVYHVGTGQSRSIGEGLHELIRLSGRNVQVEDVPCRRGPSDSRADISKLSREVGWTPRFAWERTMIDLWIEVLRRSGSRRVA